MDVYKASAFEDRVNYAASCISSSGGHVPQGRHFDTCFEMGDADYVAAALVRRTIKNPASKLAQYLFKCINREMAMENYESTKHLTRKQLRETAIAENVPKLIASGYCTAETA
jgi:hypothetical protein